VQRKPRLPEEPDRRRSGRFPLLTELDFWVSGRRGNGEAGSGRVLDVSGNGILFQSEKPLDVGTRVKLSIPWPVRLNQECKLKLLVEGRVARRQDNLVAVQFEKWEFRTPGSRNLKTA